MVRLVWSICVSCSSNFHLSPHFRIRETSLSMQSYTKKQSVGTQNLQIAYLSSFSILSSIKFGIKTQLWWLFIDLIMMVQRRIVVILKWMRWGDILKSSSNDFIIMNVWEMIEMHLLIVIMKILLEWISRIEWWFLFLPSSKKEKKFVISKGCWCGGWYSRIWKGNETRWVFWLAAYCWVYLWI